MSTEPRQQTENVAILTFDEESKAYQALSVLKRLDGEGRLDLRSASVITHEATGNLRVEEREEDGPLGSRALTGGLVGSLVGILGGPLGVLLGWGVGASIGLRRDANALEDDLSLVELIGTAIPAGSTGLIAEVFEPATEVIDGEMARLGGTVIRRPSQEVRAEIEQTQEAEKSARDEASRVMRQKRQETRRANVEATGASFRERHERLDEQGIVEAVREYRNRS